MKPLTELELKYKTIEDLKEVIDLVKNSDKKNKKILVASLEVAMDGLDCWWKV